MSASHQPFPLPHAGTPAAAPALAPPTAGTEDPPLAPLGPLLAPDALLKDSSIPLDAMQLLKRHSSGLKDLRSSLQDIRSFPAPSSQLLLQDFSGPGKEVASSVQTYLGTFQALSHPSFSHPSLSHGSLSHPSLPHASLSHGSLPHPSLVHPQLPHASLHSAFRPMFPKALPIPRPPMPHATWMP